MIIYDYQNQNLIDYKHLINGFFLILVGLFLFIFSKYKPEAKEDFFTDLFGLTKFQLAEKINNFSKISKMMGIIIFITSGFFFILQ